jgi:hypothetical protein
VTKGYRSKKAFWTGAYMIIPDLWDPAFPDIYKIRLTGTKIPNPPTIAKEIRQGYVA